MNKVSLADVLHLSISERIQLVEDIWDSIASLVGNPGVNRNANDFKGVTGIQVVNPAAS